jgi:hypothetical protein
MSYEKAQSLESRIEWTADGVTIQTFTPTLIAAWLGDIPITQGATLALPITWKDETQAVLDLSTGYTAVLKARQTFTSASTVISLSNSDGITLAAIAPNITIVRTATHTAAYTGWLRIIWDLEITRTSDSRVWRLAAGTFTLRKEVTT